MPHLVSRAHTWLGLGALLVGTLLVSGTAHAVVLEDTGLADPAPLVCPVPPRPTARPTPTTPTPPLPQPEPDDTADADLWPLPVPDLTSVDAVAAMPAPKALRIALWGDSHTAAGFLSEGLIQGLGYTPDEVASGFIPASFGLAGVRLPVRKVCVGPGWGRTHAFRTKAAGAVLPPSLVQGKTTESGGYLWLDFRTTARPQGLAALDVPFSPPDALRVNNTVLAVSLNGAPERVVSLDRSADRLLELRSANGIQTVQLRLISGELAIDGLLPHHTTSPKLLLDTFGIPGATARGWEVVDPTAFTMLAAPDAQTGGESQASRPPRSGYDLLLLAYGTNEGSDTGYDPAKYAASLRTGLRNLRTAYPQAACMLLGPTDRGVPVRQAAASGTAKRSTQPPRPPPLHPLHYSRIHRSISEVQKRVGAEFGCRFWDWQSFMGGPGGARRWLAQNPPLMAPDLIHLTVQGYRVSGQRLGALLRGR